MNNATLILYYKAMNNIPLEEEIHTFADFLVCLKLDVLMSHLSNSMKQNNLLKVCMLLWSVLMVISALFKENLRVLI